MGRLQSGKTGELAAERYFLDNGWKMVRTQPPIRILGVEKGSRFGMIYKVRMEAKGGVPDYTGFRETSPGPGTALTPVYLACEVKEANGDTMPASRLDREQRDFMKALPAESAFVGIFWVEHQRFTLQRFIEKGSYKLSAGSLILP